MLRATPGRNAIRFDLEHLPRILAFVNARVTWAVVECGLRGRVDSTNTLLISPQFRDATHSGDSNID